MLKGQRKSSTPGFRYVGKTKTAHLEVLLPGSVPIRRRRKTIVGQVVRDGVPVPLTRDVALEEWKRFREEVLAPPPTPAAPLTLRAYYAAHWPTMRLSLSKAGAESVENAMKARLLPFLGDVPMKALNLAVVRDLVGRLRAEAYAPGSINGALSVLRKFLRDAVAREVLEVYPIKGRLPLQKEELLRLEMSDEEEARFLAAFDDEAAFAAHVEEAYREDEVAWLEDMRQRQPGRQAKPPLDPRAVAFHRERFRELRPLFVVALETGLRRGDLLGLRWASVDLKAGRIRLTMSKTKREAVIPLSPACAAALKERRKAAPFSEGVFLNEDGTEISEKRLERAFVLAKRIAGIKRRLRFHDLRHTWASKLASRGVSIQVISKALGHTSTRMSERYAKPSDEAMNAIVEALSGSRMNSGMNTEPLAATGTAPGEASKSSAVSVSDGGRRGDRTPDHLRVKQALCR